MAVETDEKTQSEGFLTISWIFAKRVCLETRGNKRGGHNRSWWKLGNEVLYGDYLPDLGTDVRIEKWILKQ